MGTCLFTTTNTTTTATTTATTTTTGLFPPKVMSQYSLGADLKPKTHREH